MFSTRQSMSTSITSFMYKVYAWMSAGLALSSVTAYGVYADQAVFKAIFGNMFVFLLLVFAQIGLVAYLSLRINKMSYSTAIMSFFGYAALVGVTTSVIFAVYQLASIGTVFGITTLMFATFAIYGYLTKADLTSVGSMFTMMLFGIIIASLINMFFRNPMVDYVISFIGVLLFCGLTAYDTQKIKNAGEWALARGEEESKVALMGALILYLDFVNMFMFLLRILGVRRRD